MKLLIFTLFLCSSTYSQSYHFNLISVYESFFDGKKSQKVVLSNSNDQTYFLSLQEDIAYIFDHKKKLRHDFKIISRNGNKPLIRYKESLRYNKIKITDENSFKFETIKEDSIHKVLKMIFLKNKKVVSNDYIELTAQKITKNLFPLYRFSCMHLYESRMDIDPNENLAILSSKYVGNKNWTYELISIEDTAYEVNMN